MYSHFVDIKALGVTYLIGKSFLELLFLVSITPLFMARLRDINWPVLFSLILFPYWLFSLKNIVIYLMVFGHDRSSGVPEMFGASLAIVTIVLLLILVFKKSNSNNALQPTAESGG